MGKERMLGSWMVNSGNCCYATLVLDAHRGLNITFTWNRPPDTNDYQEFYVTVRPAPMERAGKIIMNCAETMKTIQDLVAEGLVEQIGTTVDGDPIWGATKAGGRSPQARPGSEPEVEAHVRAARRHRPPTVRDAHGKNNRGEFV